MKKLLVIIILIVSSISLMGCWDYKIYEQVGFDLQVGVELDKDGELLTTRVMPVIERENQNKVNIYTTTGTLIRETRDDARLKAPKRAEGGKVQQVLVSKQLAQSGINDIFEVFERDAINPIIAYVIVSDESPNKLLKIIDKFENKPSAPFYINSLVKNNVKASNIAEMRIYNFDIECFAPGIDPMVPIIHLEEDQQLIDLEKVALFSGDKMVGEVTVEQSKLLLAMKNKFKFGDFVFKSVEVQSELKKGVATSLSLVKHNIDVKINDYKPEVKIKLKFSCIFNEYTWGSLLKADKKKQYEESLKKEMEKKCLEVLKYTQEINSDPLGIGDIVRAKYNNYWKSNDWNKVYKDIIFDIDVGINIAGSGVSK